MSSLRFWIVIASALTLASAAKVKSGTSCDTVIAEYESVFKILLLGDKEGQDEVRCMSIGEL